LCNELGIHAQTFQHVGGENAGFKEDFRLEIRKILEDTTYAEVWIDFNLKKGQGENVKNINFFPYKKP